MAAVASRVFVADLLCLSPFYDRYLVEALAAELDATLYTTSFAYEPGYFATTQLPRAKGLLDRVAGFQLKDKRVRRALSLLEYAFNARRLLSDARASRAQVVHVQWLPLLERTDLELRLIEALKRAGCAVVYTAHNALPHDSGQRHLARYRRAYAAMDRIVVHTEHERARLTQELSVAPERVDLVGHGPMFHDMPRTERGAARARLGLEDDDEVVLFLGLLRPYKGVDDLLEAMPALLAARPRARLLLGGQGDARYVGALRARVQALGLGDRVVLHERYVPVEQLPVFYAAADISALPYRAASQSGALLTAVGFEASVVATRVGGLAETLLKAGFEDALVAPGDPVALSQLLARELARPAAEQNARGRRLRAWVDAHESWPSIARATAQVYQRAIAERESR